jgi:hypothetical protein
VTIFNRITTSIEQAARGGFRIRIRYWSTEHQEAKEELSRRVFTSPIEAEDTAVRVAHSLRERLG